MEFVFISDNSSLSGGTITISSCAGTGMEEGEGGVATTIGGGTCVGGFIMLSLTSPSEAGLF